MQHRLLPALLVLLTLVLIAPSSPLRHFLSAFASTYSTTVLADSPAGYWRLGETTGTTAADSAGTNSGSYSGGYTLGQAGAITGDTDAAVGLNGSSGLVNLNQSSTLMPTAALTVEGWIKPSSALPDNATLFHSAEASNAGGYGISSVNGHLRMFVYYNSTSTNFAQAITATPIGAWTHVVGTWDGSQIKVYFNGQLQAATPDSAIYYGTVSQNAQIGAYASNSYLNGSVDEVAVYPSALSAARIATHYQTGSGNVPPGAPTAVSVTGGANQATVSWTAPASNGSSPISGYTVTPHLGSTLRSPANFNSTNTSQTLTGLSAGSYTFTVAANSAAGSSAASTASAATTVTGTTYGYSGTILGDSPKAYWRLGEASGTAMTDASGNGADGLYLGNVTFARGPAPAGDPDTAILLDGSTGLGRSANASQLTLTGALSLEAWVRFSTAPAGSQIFVEKGDGNTAAGTAYRLGYNASGFVFTTCIGSTCTTAAKSQAPTLFQWYHIVGTRSAAGALTLYLNGAQVATASDGGAALNSVSAALGVGGPGLPVSGATWSSLNGSLDEVAVYPAALSAGQVAIHWQAGGYVPGTPTNVTATAGTYQATVSWIQPSYAGTSPITNYSVTPYVGAQAYPSVSAVTASSVVMPNLNAGVAYTFVVTAINASGPGAASAASNSVTVAGTTPYGSTILADSPTAYWRLDETTGTSASDLSGHGNNATYTGGYSLNQTGLILNDPDASTSLNGSTGYVSAPSLTPLTGDNARTVELWFKTTNTGQQPLFYSGTTTGSGPTYIVLTQNGGIGNSPHSNTPGLYVVVGADSTYMPGLYLADGLPHHVAVMLTGTTLQVFVDGRTPFGYQYLGSGWSDGADQPFTLPSGTPNTSSSVVWLGQGQWAIWNNGSTFYNGTIDEAAVYPAALSAAQVLSHWYKAGYAPPAPTSVTASAGTNQAYVSWTPPATTGVDPITSYTVSATVGSGTTITVDGSATRATITGLNSGASYTFTVTAANSRGSGPASAASNSVTIAGNTAAYSTAITGDSPTAYWRLDDASGTTASDASGNNHPGTYNGGYTLGQGGLIYSDSDGAVKLDGGTGYVSAPTLTPLQGGNARSVELWFQTTNSGAPQPLFDSGNTQVTGQAFNIALQPGYWSFPQNKAGLEVGQWSDDVYLPGPSLTDGRPHHVVVTLSGSTEWIYVDGQTPPGYIWNGSSWSLSQRAQPFTLPTAPNTASNPIWIGRGRTWSPGYFGGTIDEVAVYSVALSATQIENHWSKGGYVPNAPTGVQASAGTSQATVSWTAPTFAGAGPIASYVITPLRGTTPLSPTSVPATATSATILGLSAGLSYTFTVAAANSYGVGTASSASNQITLGGSSYSATMLGDLPTAYWRLDETSGTTALDSSGNNHTATYNGGYQLTSPSLLAGDIDTAVAFNGSNGYGSGPVLTPLTGGNARSVELWFQTTSTGQQPLFYSGTSTGGGPTYLVLTQNNGVGSSPPSNTPGLYVVSGGDSTYMPGLNLGDGHAHHVVATLSGSTVQVYVDDTTPAGYQWLGSSWSGLRTQPFTLPGGAPSTSSDVVWLGRGQWAIWGNGSTYFGGTLDEVAVYPTALTATQVQNHWVAGGHAPKAPQNVTATAQVDSVALSWSAPAAVGDTPIASYIAQAYSAGSLSATTTVSDNATGATVAGLSPAVSYTFTVTAKNATYQGPASAPTAGVNPLAPSQTALGDYYFYSCACNDGGQAIGNYGLTSQANVPAMSQWTIEGWIGGQSSLNTTGSNAAWGLLSGSAASPGTGAPVAGINFHFGGSPLQTAFVWPGGSSALPADSAGVATAFNTSNYSHAALTYDGSTVRGFINGILQFSTATTSAATTAAPAGWMDEVAIAQTKYDELRISNVARYTANFTPQTSNFASDANTMLLWHLDDYGIAKLPSTTIWPNSYYTRPGAFGDSSSHSNHGQVMASGTSCIICGPVYSLYSLAPGVSPSEVAGGGSPWICPCTRAATDYPVNTATGEFYHSFTDFSIPGRGPALDFERTYSSQNASTLGPFGYGWALTYAGSVTVNGNTATVVAPNGSAATFTWNGTAYVGPAHVLATLVKNGDGTYTFTDKSKTQFSYSTAGQLTKEVDRNGYATNLAYTGGNLTSITDPAGRTLTLAYQSGLISSITDTASPARAVLFTYDGSSNLVQVQDSRGGKTQFSYDAGHLLLTMKDPNCVNAGGNCDGVRNTYSNGQVTRQLDPLNRATTFNYQSTPIGTTTTITDPKGNVTVEEYANNVLLSETKGQGTAQQATWTYKYDTGTLARIQTTDPNGHSLVLVRDGQANVLTQIDALGRTATSTYNSFNEPLVVTDALGVATTNSYDGSGNLTQTSTPLVGSSPAQSKTTVYTYGDVNHPGDVTQVSDPDAKLWTYGYDANGDKTSVTDPLQNKTTYVFDGVGRMTSKVTPNGNVTGGNPSLYTWSYAYNNFNQKTSVTDPLSNQTSYQYDPNGNLTLVTDAKLNQTQYFYDSDNEQTSEIDGLGSSSQRTQQTTYDGDGNIYQQVDGNRNITSYTYDPLNRKATMSDPLLRQTVYSYDLDGNLTSVRDPKGQTTNYGYDSGDELVNVSYSDGATPNVAYAYDADGQRLSMSDGTGTTTYSYDSLHRLTQSTNGAGAQVQYGYDLKGQLTSLTYPGGVNKVTRTYDGAGRLSTVADWLSHTTSYGYDADSNPNSTTYGNGTTRSSTYDYADRLMGITDSKSGTAFLTLSYGRDNNSLLTSDSGTSYGYDPLNRVTSAASASYQYDKADQLTQMAISGGNTTAETYDIAGQLKTSTVSNGQTQVSKLSFSFDANGNRTRTIDQNNVNTTLGYDAANRLANYNGSAGYAYNGDGLRMSKTVSGSTTSQTWNTAEGLPTMVQDGSLSYVTGGGGLPLEQISGSTVYWYHEDQLGSVRALTDATGVVQQTYAFDPYGVLASSSGSITNPFRYAGQYFDSETGFYYLRARFYDPASEQFLSRDPVFMGTREAYTYVRDSALNVADPAGLCSFWQCAVSFGVAFAKATLWNSESLVGFAPYGFYNGAYSYNREHRTSPIPGLRGLNSLVQRVALKLDEAWDVVQQSNDYPDANVDDEGIEISKSPSVYVPAQHGCGWTVEKKTYGPYIGPSPGRHHGHEDYAD